MSGRGVPARSEREEAKQLSKFFLLHARSLRTHVAPVRFARPVSLVRTSRLFRAPRRTLARNARFARPVFVFVCPICCLHVRALARYVVLLRYVSFPLRA